MLESTRAKSTAEASIRQDVLVKKHLIQNTATCVAKSISSYLLKPLFLEQDNWRQNHKPEFN